MTAIELIETHPLTFWRRHVKIGLSVLDPGHPLLGRFLRRQRSLSAPPAPSPSASASPISVPLPVPTPVPVAIPSGAIIVPWGGLSRPDADKNTSKYLATLQSKQLMQLCNQPLVPHITKEFGEHIA